MRRGAFLLIALLAGGLSLSSAGASVAPPRGPETLPRLMLWAWERPVDLLALDAGIGVAFLSQTLIVRNGAVEAMPRRNPLKVSDHTPLVAVTRVETGGGAAALRSPELASMVTAIAGTAMLPRVAGVQIDFDAAESERAFYRELVQAVRTALGQDVPLSITALASWCTGDRWLQGLSVTEVVPMLFRLGPVNEPYTGMASAPRAAAPECQAAIGTALDEPLYTRARGRRVYVFNPGSWTPASVARAREVLQ